MSAFDILKAFPFGSVERFSAAVKGVKFVVAEEIGGAYPFIQPMMTVEFGNDGTIVSDEMACTWKCADSLIIVDKSRKRRVEFSCVTSINGLPCFKGWFQGNALRKALMWPSVKLGESGRTFSIAVATYAGRYQRVVRRLLRSLEKHASDIPAYVCVADSKEPGPHCAGKTVTVIGTQQNAREYTPLVMIASKNVSVESEYVLLLHDSCEVIDSFLETVSAIEVGLAFDAIYALQGVDGKPHTNIGLYSTDFLLSLGRGSAPIGDMAWKAFKQTGRTDAIYRTVRSRMMAVRFLQTWPPPLTAAGDVYGEGEEKKTMRLAFGVDKHTKGA